MVSTIRDNPSANEMLVHSWDGTLAMVSLINGMILGKISRIAWSVIGIAAESGSL